MRFECLAVNLRLGKHLGSCRALPDHLLPSEALTTLVPSNVAFVWKGLPIFFLI